MKNKIKYVNILITLVFIFSCEDEININGNHLPVLNVALFKDAPEMISLNHGPVNGNLISASIYQTLDLHDTLSSNQKVENPRIEIYCEDELIKVIEPENEKGVIDEWNPIEGKIYRVYGYTDNYPVLYGECSLPITVPINYIEYASENVSNSNQVLFSCLVNFTDPINNDNYYEIWVKGNSTERNHYFHIIPKDPILEFRRMFSDDFINGHNYSIQFELLVTQEEIEFYEEIIFELHSISESFYTANRLSYLAHESDDDIYSEPVQHYSNVENGLGIIIASTVSRDTIRFE